MDVDQGEPYTMKNKKTTVQHSNTTALPCEACLSEKIIISIVEYWMRFSFKVIWNIVGML